MVVSPGASGLGVRKGNTDGGILRGRQISMNACLNVSAWNSVNKIYDQMEKWVG